MSLPTARIQIFDLSWRSCVSISPHESQSDKAAEDPHVSEAVSTKGVQYSPPERTPPGGPALGTKIQCHGGIRMPTTV